MDSEEPAMEIVIDQSEDVIEEMDDHDEEKGSGSPEPFSDSAVQECDQQQADLMHFENRETPPPEEAIITKDEDKSSNEPSSAIQSANDDSQSGSEMISDNGLPTIYCNKKNIKCSRCQTTDSLYWRTLDNDNLICITCNEATTVENKEEAECEENSQGGSESPETPNGSLDNEEQEEHDDSAPPKAPSPRKRELRKATRLKTAKSVKNLVKSRRTALFKKVPPTKTTPPLAHFITSNYVRHKGSYLQSGDIVSMLGDDSEIYYAQLRTFLVDQFGQLSATITWLIPTERSPSDGTFDPATFVIGPEEDFPRELRSMSFECHAPSDYYLARDRPILYDSRKGCKAFTWTTFGEPRAIWDTTESQQQNNKS